MPDRFDAHPKKVEAAKAANTTIYTIRNLIKSGVWRGVRYTNEERPHRDDVNKYLEEGLSPTEMDMYSSYLSGLKAARAERQEA